jgi:hypothetical protein
MGWEVQPPQPPHPRPERFGSIAPKEDGIEAAFVLIPSGSTFRLGWDVQSFQPPNANIAKQNIRAGGTMRGIDGTDGLVIIPFIEGWQIQPPQPPAWPPIRIKIAATVGNDDASMGDQPPLMIFDPKGWEIQPWQPPSPSVTPTRRAGGVMRGDDGTSDIGRVFRPFGWPIQPPQPPHPRREKFGALVVGEQGDEAIFAFVPVGSAFPQGWEVQPIHPLRWPRRQIAGAVMRGDDGTEHQFFAARYFDGMGPLGYALRVRPNKPPDGGDGGTEAPIPVNHVGWQPVLPDIRFRGWRPTMPELFLIDVLNIAPDAANWQIDPTEFIRYRRPVPGLEMEPAYLPLPRYIPWGYDHTETLFPRKRWPSFPIGDVVEVRIPPIIWGFDGTDRFPGFKRRYRSGTDRDFEYFSTFPAHVWGQEPVLPFFKPRRVRYPLDRGYEIVSNFAVSFPLGWPVQPWQPPHRGREKSGALARWDDGTEQVEIVQFPNGWESVLVWPPHPRAERSGAVALGDIGGAWGPFIYLVPSGATGWDFPVYVANPFDIAQPPAAIAWDFAVYLAAAYDIGQPPK